MWSSENCKEQTLSIKLRVAPEHCWVWQQQNKEKKRAFLLLGILNSHHCPLFLPTVTRHPPPQTAEQERKQTFSIKPGPVGSANLSEPHSPRWPLIFPGAGSNRLLLQKAITGCQGQEPRRKQSPPPHPRRLLILIRAVSAHTQLASQIHPLLCSLVSSTFSLHSSFTWDNISPPMSPSSLYHFSISGHPWLSHLSNRPDGLKHTWGRSLLLPKMILGG